MQPNTERKGNRATTNRRVVGPATESSYSHGVSVEGRRLVFVAGQVPRDDLGRVVGAGDFEAQARDVLSKIEGIVRDAGGTKANVVKITTFLTDIGNYPAFDRVRRDFFVEKFPASTLFAVKALVRPEFLIEVEAIAVLD